MNRRQFLRTATGLAATASVTLTGCDGELIDALIDACPEDPSESGNVTWTPSVMYPVFYGYQDLSETDGAPGVARIWYPTYEGFTTSPPILKLCLVRYPIVLFLHGQPPCLPAPDYHTRWFAIPAVLARSGYVVIVPEWDARLDPNETYPPALSLALDFLDWVHTAWSERKWVAQQFVSTAVVGHSYGALLAARLVHLRPSIPALVSLSAPWGELDDGDVVLSGLTLPKLLVWGRGLEFEDLDRSWDGVPAPKHGAVHDDEHFDYIPALPGCTAPRGPCEEIQGAMADLVALFLSRYMPVQPSTTNIPVSLEPPPAPLTVEQEFYAGGRLSGLETLERGGEECRIDLRWQDGGPPGSRTLGG
jgi:pimeloyl-ACP methyl ester carboxylesterase